MSMGKSSPTGGNTGGNQPGFDQAQQFGQTMPTNMYGTTPGQGAFGPTPGKTGGLGPNPGQPTGMTPEQQDQIKAQTDFLTGTIQPTYQSNQPAAAGAPGGLNQQQQDYFKYANEQRAIEQQNQQANDARWAQRQKAINDAGYGTGSAQYGNYDEVKDAAALKFMRDWDAANPYNNKEYDPGYSDFQRYAETKLGFNPRDPNNPNSVNGYANYDMGLTEVRAPKTGYNGLYTMDINPVEGYQDRQGNYYDITGKPMAPPSWASEAPVAINPVLTPAPKAPGGAASPQVVTRRGAQPAPTPFAPKGGAANRPIVAPKPAPNPFAPKGGAANRPALTMPIGPGLPVGGGYNIYPKDNPGVALPAFGTAPKQPPAVMPAPAQRQPATKSGKFAPVVMPVSRPGRIL